MTALSRASTDFLLVYGQWDDILILPGSSPPSLLLVGLGMELIAFAENSIIEEPEYGDVCEQTERIVKMDYVDNAIEKYPPGNL